MNNFIKLSNKESGIGLRGEVRDIIGVNVNTYDELLVLNNNDSLQTFSFIK